MNTWWYYYYSALLQINWNCHKALKSISPNPVLLHSLVLKIAAAVWQFSLNLSTCPKTGTFCVIHNNHAARFERSVLTISRSQQQLLLFWPRSVLARYVVAMPVYGLLLSNQSEPPNVHKNWIPSQGKTKYKTSVSLSCILDFRATSSRV